jgi:hypothetical protein
VSLVVDWRRPARSFWKEAMDGTRFGGVNLTTEAMKPNNANATIDDV